jgi:hypothetical protein
METTPPGKSTGREIVERAAEAGLGSIPVAGAALAVTFVTVVNWRLNQRREKWFTELAEAVEELGHGSMTSTWTLWRTTISSWMPW